MQLLRHYVVTQFTDDHSLPYAFGSLFSNTFLVFSFIFDSMVDKPCKARLCNTSTQHAMITKLELRHI